MVSLGFVVTRFSLWVHSQSGRPPDARANGLSFPMGEALIVFGGLLAIMAAWHYHLVARRIEEDRVRPDRVLVILVTVMVAALASAMAIAIRA